MSPLFLATVESVEEAIYNSLIRATTVVGRPRVRQIVREALEKLRQR